MAAHLFGSVTLPPDLGLLVDIHRRSLDRGVGRASLVEGWRAFLAHTIATGPMSLLQVANQHLDHVADAAAVVIDELLESDWPEAIALGVACRALAASADGQQRTQSQLTEPEIGRALLCRGPTHDTPSVWVVELDFGETRSCACVWVNGDGSLRLLYLSDESIADVESFLDDIDDAWPKQPFTVVLPRQAIAPIRAAAADLMTDPGERRILTWLVRALGAS